MPSENIKAIFGSLPEIHDVHSRMAEELKDLMEAWSDAASIGCVVIKYVSDNASGSLTVSDVISNKMVSL